MPPTKLIVLGPNKSGKTVLSNFIANATEMAEEYHPTQGVRILEFETQNSESNKKHLPKDIELWDCSGDSKFRSCWPAIRQNTQGVIFVYNEKSSNHLEELEILYDYFVKQTRLGPENCVIFYFNPDNSSSGAHKSVVLTFPKISHVKCNIDEGGNKLRSDFNSFLNTLTLKIKEHVDQEDNILLTK